MTGCKTKQVSKNSEIQNEIIQNSLQKDSVKSVDKILEKESFSKKETVDQKKHSQTEVEISGKAESDKPVEFFNVDNGDTLQSIKIYGNAEVKIRSKASNLNHSKTESKSETVVEKLKEFSQNIVKENNVKERMSEMKQKTKQIDVTGFQAGAWIFASIVAFLAILIFFTYKYLKK